MLRFGQTSIDSISIPKAIHQILLLDMKDNGSSLRRNLRDGSLLVKESDDNVPIPFPLMSIRFLAILPRNVPSNLPYMGHLAISKSTNDINETSGMATPDAKRLQFNRLLPVIKEAAKPLIRTTQTTPAAPLTETYQEGPEGSRTSAIFATAGIHSARRLLAGAPADSLIDRTL
jgi:hypothetical protein